MAIQNYRVYSTKDQGKLVSELNAVLDGLNNRLAALENGPTQPNGDINMGGTPSSTIGKQYKITNLAPATDTHDALTLGQLQDAINNLKEYIDTKGNVKVKYVKNQAKT